MDWLRSSAELPWRRWSPSTGAMRTGLSGSPTVRRDNTWKGRTAILRSRSGVRLGLSHASAADLAVPGREGRREKIFRDSTL